MREIKFRAWDRAWGVMRYDLTITNEYWSYTKGTFSCGANHETLMQFTGIKDKNGKEIFESDLCLYGDITNDTCGRVRGRVVWYPSKCQFLLQEIEENHRGGHYISYWDAVHDLEVIGNIYENKEIIS